MAAGAEPSVLADALSRADVLSLHAPALPETRHMIGAAELALLRPGATLINTARGSLVDTAALERACASCRLDATRTYPSGSDSSRCTVTERSQARGSWLQPDFRVAGNAER
ncbi:NAD(P)-dependent oxidoreductase [Arthrobacter sp. StoSoilB5]|uniref:NAD(P)-dependent oxidoreductase n=1 Tax=Arthrobacter sp. StoSoilB5 TaxID=2830992 RepID=UPI0021E1491D|nr:NAD(P)-dependent oxidoreductase [Arthrobacter sp. StoSoilB5]